MRVIDGTARRPIEGHCQRPGCGAPVYWLTHERTGRVAPIDREEDGPENGNCRVDLEAGTYAVSGRLTERRMLTSQHGVGWHAPHWETCKDKPPRPRPMKGTDG
jgi:hypothetical protein